MSEPQSKTRVVAVLGVGMYALPRNRQAPYFVTLDLNGDGRGVAQDMDATSFFAFLNSLIAPRAESCGNTHVPTVTVPA